MGTTGAGMLDKRLGRWPNRPEGRTDRREPLIRILRVAGPAPAPASQTRRDALMADSVIATCVALGSWQERTT